MIGNVIKKISKSFRFSKKKSLWKNENFFTKDLLNNRYDIGEYTYGQPLILFPNDQAKLTIGKFCSIAADVLIFLGGNHRTEWVTTYPFNVIFDDANYFKGHPATKGDVTIGNDVWIGHGSTILSGVSIGNGAVVAAKSVVTKNVEPYTIVGGNPARVLKYRFSKEIIEKLQIIEWWNWDFDKISDNWELLLSNRIDTFVNKHHPTE